ncbi:915_t:CDS:2, partial [Ambispora leptoticha]
LLAALQKTGTEAEVKNLIRNFTQHLNKLAGEGEKNTLSTEREEMKGLSSGGNLVNLTERDFMEELEN